MNDFNFPSNRSHPSSNMKLDIILIVCIAIATAKSIPDKTDRQGGVLDNLTKEQQQCLINAVQKDITVMLDLKKCREFGGGLDCIKTISALKGCFGK